MRHILFIQRIFFIKEDGTICLPIYMIFAFKKANIEFNVKTLKMR